MAVARYVLKTSRASTARPSPRCCPTRRRRLHDRARPGRQRRLHAEHLLQFAVMGSALVSAVDGKEEPSVGLLNIGEEAIKGSETIKRPANCCAPPPPPGTQLPRQRGRQRHLQGHDRPRGLRRLRRQRGAEDQPKAWPDAVEIHQARNSPATPLTKLAALVAHAGAEALQGAVDHRRYNGAALLGLRGLVFKSHGSADAFAFEQALARAYDAARNRLLDRVHDRIRETLAAMPVRRGGASDRSAGRCQSRMTMSSRHRPRLFPHRRHRQLPAAAAPDQRRLAANWPARRRDQRRLDRRAHRHPRAPLRRRRRHQQRPGRPCRAPCAGGGRPQAADIDLIIVATSTPDMVFPSTACILQNKLGIVGARPSTCRRCARASSMR
jgi:hypothetical protein